jgi:methyl-accepting chemotaxis protein
MTNPDFAIGIQYELRQLVTATTELAERIESTNEGINRLRETVTTGFDELKQITQQQADTARMQAESVNRLIALLERRERS